MDSTKTLLIMIFFIIFGIVFIATGLFFMSDGYLKTSFLFMRKYLFLAVIIFPRADSIRLILPKQRFCQFLIFKVH